MTLYALQFTTQHITTQHNTTQRNASLRYATLRHTTPHHTTPHYTTLHVLHRTTGTTATALAATLITLHYNYNSTTLHYNYNYNCNDNCSTLHCIQQLWWGDHCNHCNHSKNIYNSNHLSAHHQWIRSAIRDSQQPTSPRGFLFLKLPPPPCAVLLVCVEYSL